MSGRLERGGLIDRSKPLGFSFDSRRHQGYHGDTLASALLANGVRLVGRSFKYHRPRGFLSAGPEEPNGLFEIGEGAHREPNTRGTVQELYDGLVASSQNRWPSLRFDVLSFNDWLAPFLSAGFYYKTFMWPASFWEKVYEPFIRRAAGLGALSGEPDPDAYDHGYGFCDILVVGAGPAGLMAALAAGRAGARVIVADEDFLPGGRLNGEALEVDGRPGHEWAGEVAAELASMPNVRVMKRTAVFGAYDSGDWGLYERLTDHLGQKPEGIARGRLWHVNARRTIIACGSIERPIAFAGNDVPGVMMAGAVRTYLNRFAVAPGKRAVVFTNNEDGWRTARDLLDAGQEVAAVVDTRKGDRVPAGMEAVAGETRVAFGVRITGVLGRKSVRGVEILDGDGHSSVFAADLLAVSGGWNPTVHLTSHKGAKPVWREDIAAFVASKDRPGDQIIAGTANGAFSTAQALGEGLSAAEQALSDLGRKAPRLRVPKAENTATAIEAFWHVGEARGRAFIDFQNDVTAKDVKLAHAEGYRAVEHLKRYTTLGMATDQGKTANVTGLAVMAELTGRTIAETGTTVFRPPTTPVPIGAFAGRAHGRHQQPTRLTASHDWATERGAVFVEAGNWLRAQWFAQPGETDWRQSCDREAAAVRRSVGVCDVSTLGKIDIQGPDAATLLDRVYTNTFSTLAVGKARYGLMLREDGMMFDDGTASRLGETHFLMTTTTANAVGVMRHLEHATQVIWPDLDVQMISATEQWAQFAIAGPKSREVVARLVDEDVSNEAFPYMGVAEVTVCGVAGRLFRLSFSGELGFEVAVPARHGDALIRAIMEVGAQFEITPYGTEALNVLRIEKGHVTGAELNGQTTAADLGFARMVSAKKDCIGKVMAGREGLVDEDRPRLAGFVAADGQARLWAGSHFIEEDAPADLAHSIGHMTSVCYSPHLGRYIGLGLVRGGAARAGDTVRMVHPLKGIDIAVEIAHPVFLDPQGERLRG